MLKEILVSAGVMGGLGVLFAAGLAWAAGKFRVDSDPKVELLASLLPGANCGSCGCSGCSGYAEALAAGKASVDACRVVGAEARKEICTILGIDPAGELKKQVAKVRCRGDYKLARWLAHYEGVRDCRAAVLVGSSPKGCHEGCLGLGTCATVCVFGAITIGEDHLPVVDEEKCTGCGACVSACPRKVLALMDYDVPLVVRCNSHDKGKLVREYCQVGCLACRACVRVCEQQAMSVVNNLAEADAAKCTACGACAAKCPSGCIELTKPPATEKKMLA